MDNHAQLVQCFVKGLQISKRSVKDNLAYASIAEWDSLAHMALVAEIDSSFDIMLDTDDIIDMSSFAKTREILKKYDVEF